MNDIFSMAGWQKIDKLKLDAHQRDTIIIAQAIRNDFENFHGGMGDGKMGFLTDEQMKMLNISVRHTVYKALEMIKGLPNTPKELDKQMGQYEPPSPFVYCGFNLTSFDHDYMELPGTPELEKAYKEFVEGYEGE